MEAADLAGMLLAASLLSVARSLSRCSVMRDLRAWKHSRHFTMRTRTLRGLRHIKISSAVGQDSLSGAASGSQIAAVT